jgi:hypothetical protein
MITHVDQLLVERVPVLQAAVLVELSPGSDVTAMIASSNSPAS